MKKRTLVLGCMLLASLGIANAAEEKHIEIITDAQHRAVTAKQQVWVRHIPMSLIDLVETHGIAFKGKLLSRKHATIQDGSGVKVLTFAVEDIIDGISQDELNADGTLSVKIWDAIVSETDKLQIGESNVLFFHSKSPNGLTSLNGGIQGLVNFKDGKPNLHTHLPIGKSFVDLIARDQDAGLIKAVRQDDDSEILELAQKQDSMNDYEDFKNLCNDILGGANNE